MTVVTPCSLPVWALVQHPDSQWLTGVEGWWPLSAPVPTQCGPWSSTRLTAHRRRQALSAPVPAQCGALVHHPGLTGS